MIASLALALALVASLAAASFCAGCETGFFSVSRGRVLHLAHEGSRAAKILQTALADLPRTVTGLLVGNNLAAVTYSSASAALAARVCADSAWARSAWSAAAALAILYLGEFLPKLFCSARPLRRMLALAPAYRAFERTMSPLTAVAVALTSLFVPKSDVREKVTSADLLRILQDRKDGVRLTDFESALISRILVLRRKGAAATPEAILSALDE